MRSTTYIKLSRSAGQQQLQQARQPMGCRWLFLSFSEQRFPVENGIIALKSSKTTWYSSKASKKGNRYKITDKSRIPLRSNRPFDVTASTKHKSQPVPYSKESMSSTSRACSSCLPSLAPKMYPFFISAILFEFRESYEIFGDNCKNTQLSTKKTYRLLI